MPRQFLWSAGILLAGILIGVVSGRWETAGDVVPQLRSARDVSPAGDPQSASAKAVVVNGEIHDFGVMEQNGTKSHTFIIRNDGGLPLKLTKGTTTCKCTLSNISDTIVDPGATAEVKLEWSAKTGEPEFTQSAEIHTSDVRRSTIRLVVRGKVRQALRGDRTDLVFNLVTVDDEATARMRVFAYLSDTLEIVKHEFMNAESADKFTVAYEPLTADEIAQEPNARAGIELSVNLKPGLPLGPISQVLRLTTNLDGSPTLEIPFNGRIISDITLMGSDRKVDGEKNIVSLGTLERGERGKLTFFLLVKGSHRDATEIKLAGVEPADRLRVQLGEPIRDNPKIVRIPVTIETLEGALAGNFLGTGDVNNTSPTGMLSLTTTHPHVPELKIKVRFLIKD